VGYLRGSGCRRVHPDLRRLVSLARQPGEPAAELKLRLTSLLRDHRVTLPMARWTRPGSTGPGTGTLPAVGHLIAVEILDQLPDVMDRIRRVQDQMDLFTQGDPNIAYLRPCPAWAR